MARWERAVSILRQRVPTGERVLDLGCAIGWGTAKIARYYDTYGLEPSPDYAQRAQRRAASAQISVGVAEQLPYPDAYFAAVTLLDVFEHVNDERAVVAEIARVLRPGGLLVLSVPHAGLLRWADSLNVFAWLTGEDPLSPPGTAVQSFKYHRHYSVAALRALLGEQFEVDYVRGSALGLAEFVHLSILLLCKRLLRSRPLYVVLVYLYLAAYIVEDVVTLNKGGYHLMIAARRVAS